MEGATGATGPQGFQGEPGPMGPAGMVLVLDGGVVTGPAGAPVVITPLAPGAACATGGVRVTQLVDGGVVDVCNGLTGAMGPQGLQGDVGAMGAQGIAGVAGPIGPQGAQGPMGPVGPTGGIGATGVAGPAGAQGPIGPAGATGGIGPTGAVGPAGPQGATGPAGPTGGIGATGAAGPAGAQGPIGPAGATGGVGPAGVAGPAGPQGPIGPAGATGGVGPAGSTGLTGPAGAQGVAGPAGPTGAMGPQGPVGPAGSVLYLDGGVVVVTSVPVQFLGFTTATYTGNLGGLPGAAEKCRIDFAPDSYLCTIADYDASNTAAVPPTSAGAWIDFNRDALGTRTTTACSSGQSPWTDAPAQFAASAIQITSTGYAGTTACTATTAKHLACCRNSRVTFRGFTTATYTGNLGGVPGANAKCRAEFSNSWLCTIAEYDLSNTAVRPPTSAGAWIDFNRAANGTRNTTACSSGQSPWTDAPAQFAASAIQITSTGYAGTTACTATTSKHLACCGGL